MIVGKKYKKFEYNVQSPKWGALTLQDVRERGI